MKTNVKRFTDDTVCAGPFVETLHATSFGNNGEAG